MRRLICICFKVVPVLVSWMVSAKLLFINFCQIHVTRLSVRAMTGNTCYRLNYQLLFRKGAHTPTPRGEECRPDTRERRKSSLHLLWLCMFDRPLMLWVTLSFVDTIHTQSDKFVTGVKIKAAGDSKLNDSPSWKISFLLKKEKPKRPKVFPLNSKFSFSWINVTMISTIEHRWFHVTETRMKLRSDDCVF